MFRCCIILFSYVLISSTQEVPVPGVFNVSENGRSYRNHPVEYDSQEPNLWLISRDDPIPARLNGRWPVSGAISGDQILNLRSDGFSNQFLDSSSSPLQSDVTQIYNSPVIRYDRILTAADRRQSSDVSSFNIRNSGAVLVQLPVEITEGIWERPLTQGIELTENRRQNFDGENPNANRASSDAEQKPEPISSIYVPVRELTSRLPNSDFEPQGEAVISSGQFYEAPIESTSSRNDGVTGINTSTGLVTLPESSIRDIWLLRKDSLQNTAEKQTFKSNTDDHSLQSHDIHEIGSILTSEDIELLERLGILSSLVIEPLTPRDDSNNFTTQDNSQREYEDKPVLIDNVRQSYSVNSGKINASNLSDVILIDVPKFEVNGYHGNIPENTGLDTGAIRISPYTIPESESSFDQNKSKELIGQTNISLNASQLLEILEILNLNTGNIFDLSLPSAKQQEVKPEENSNFLESSKNSSASEVPRNSTTLRENFADRKIQSSSDNIPSNASEQTLQPDTEDQRKQNASSVPTVRNGRIQPRLLDKLIPRENEILERLINSPVPASESKLKILKKLQIQPQPYFFGFKQEDGKGTLQHRNETSDSKGIVKGSYGYRDAMGVYRNVSYIADEKGFHAVVKTNEPGMVSHNTADAVFMSETPPLAALLRMMAHRRPKLLSNDTGKPQHF